MIYLIIALLFLFSIFLFDSSKKNTKASVFFYWAQCIILIALAGLRNQVGGDTIGYMIMWDDLPDLSQLEHFDFVSEKYQPLWYVFNAIVKIINDDFTTFQIIHAAFVNISIFIFIKRYTEYRFTAVLIYYVVSFLNFNTEVLRESLAICVFLYAFPLLLEKKWIKYYILVTISFLFHSSSIILFALPFLRSLYVKNFSFSFYLKIFIALLIFANPFSITLIIYNFLPFLKELLRLYSNIEYWGWSYIGYTVALINSFILLLLILIRQKNNVTDELIDSGLKIYMLFSLFCLSFPIGQRFMNYFVLFFILSIVDLFWKFKNIEFLRKNIILGFFICATIQYYYLDTTKFAGIESRFFDRYYPYYSIYEDLSEKDTRVRKAIYLNEAIIEY